MMKVIYFNIATLILTATLAILMLTKNVSRRSHKIFLLMVIELFIVTGVSLGAIIMDNMANGDPFLQFALHGIYLLGHTATILLVLLYICSISDIMFRLWKNVWFILGIFAPMAILHILLAVNAFVPIIYHIEANAYVRDFLFPSVYIIGAIYFLELGFAIIKSRKVINWSAITALFVLYPLIGGAMVIELIYPHIVIEPFMNAIALLVMFVNITKPEAYVDPTTGVNNEESFKIKLKQAFYNKKPYKIILVGTVNYMSIAELLGGDKFDEYNKYIASKLREIDSFCKTHLFIAHIGGGRFRILIEEAHYDTLQLLIDNIFHQLGKKHSFGDIEVEPIPAICVLSCPDEVDSVEKYVFFSSIFPAFSENKVTYGHDLLKDKKFIIESHIDQIVDNALRNDLIQVYFQPIYEIKSGKFVSCEALTRVNDPDYGWIDTETFIRAAERSGAIHRVGDTVFDKALAFLASDEYKALNLHGMEINISVAECLDKSLISKYDALLRKHHLDPKLVNLEITETAATTKIGTFYKNVSMIHEMGSYLSIDDFGSGYSNINRMVALPVSIVKFDRSLVLLDESEKGHRVVRRMIEVVKEMGYEIVIEGVETKEQLESFKEFGVEYIQGWYFSKALPPAEFVKFVSERNK